MVNTIKLLLRSNIKESDIIRALNEETVENKGDLITKPGFTKQESNTIFSIIQSDNIDDINRLFDHLFKKNKFHQIMASFYGFTNNPLILKAILDVNETARNELINRIKVMFCLPDDYSDWDEIKTFISGDQNKWLYLEAFANGTNCPQSLYRRNLVNSRCIRGEKNYGCTNYKVADITNCHVSLKNKDTSKIVTGNTWYNIDETSFFAKLLSKYNRNYMSGPSGSAVLLYQFIFQFLDYDINETNTRLLLACLICDYIPYYHSLTEILMTYSFEINIKYNLSQDPVEFVKKIIKPQLNFSLSPNSASSNRSPPKIVSPNRVSPNRVSP